MKIALVHERFRPDGGGLERYLCAFAGKLVERGHQIHAVTADPQPADIEGVVVNHVEGLPANKRHRLRLFAERAPQVAKGLGVDRVIGLGRTYAQDIHRAGAGCHAQYQEQLAWYRRIKRKNHLELELERRLYESGETKAFVVNSNKVADEIRAHYDVGNRPIKVIRTAVDHDRFHPGDQTEALAQLGVPSVQGPVYLFVSLDHRRKGLATLLRAFARVKTGALWILGASLKGEMKALIGKHPRRTSIHTFPVADPAPFYRAADIYVLPTQYDACANTTLQALASGLPVIASAHDGASEFVVPDKNGWILPAHDDDHALAKLLNRARDVVSDDSGALQSRATHSVDSLTWDRHLLKWEEMCEDLP